jgi:energy-coupling factor transport system permease protein
MNLVSFLSLKLELFWTYKGDYEAWSSCNFERPPEGNQLLDISADDYFIRDATQWNHTGAFKTTIRLFVMIGITSLLTLSTMTTDINNGIEGLLAPLKLLHINVGVFSMLIALTLRFIPTLIEESRKIMKAQASRGVDFEEGKIKDKVKQIISLLIPMFVISFKRADELSNAMEARGYIIGEKRTKLDELKLRWRDYLCLVVTCVLMGLAIWSRFYV